MNSDLSMVGGRRTENPFRCADVLCDDPDTVQTICVGYDAPSTQQPIGRL